MGTLPLPGPQLLLHLLGLDDIGPDPLLRAGLGLEHRAEEYMSGLPNILQFFFLVADRMVGVQFDFSLKFHTGDSFPAAAQNDIRWDIRSES